MYTVLMILETRNSSQLQLTRTYIATLMKCASPSHHKSPIHLYILNFYNFADFSFILSFIAESHYQTPCVCQIYFIHHVQLLQIGIWGFRLPVAYEPFFVAIPEGSIAPALEGLRLTKPGRSQMGVLVICMTTLHDYMEKQNHRRH